MDQYYELFLSILLIVCNFWCLLRRTQNFGPRHGLYLLFICRYNVCSLHPCWRHWNIYLTRWLICEYQMEVMVICVTRFRLVIHCTCWALVYHNYPVHNYLRQVSRWCRETWIKGYGNWNGASVCFIGSIDPLLALFYKTNGLLDPSWFWILLLRKVNTLMIFLEKVQYCFKDDCYCWVMNQSFKISA